MKKVILLAAGALLLVSTSFAKVDPDREDVNEKVLKVFENTFPVVTDVKWKEYTDYYSASFKQNGVQTEVRYDKEGNFITQWTQFGKPSAIAIDNRGNIYVADGMSDTHWNPGWERGIRVADIKTGWVKAFLPDEEATKGAGTT